jgi:hypothetical protein
MRRAFRYEVTKSNVKNSSCIGHLSEGGIRKANERTAVAGGHHESRTALKVVMVLVGLLFSAGVYPMAMSLWHPSPSDDMGDTMMLSLYFTLGVFLLVDTTN